MASSAGDATRFSPISAENHAGYLWIAAILGIIYTSLSALLRAHVKRGMYGWDDLLLAVATAMHLGQTAAIFDGLRHGLGQGSLLATDGSLQMAGRTLVAADVLAVLSLCLSKCSVLSMMLRLWTRDVDQKNWATCFAILFLCVLWGVGSTLVLALDCDASSTLTRQNVEYCPSQSARWQAIATIDIATDLAILLLPVVLTWRLNMLRKQKLQVVLAFAFRIFVIPATLLHALYFDQYPHATKPPLAIIKSLLFQQVMITCSLVTATIPNLKTFMQSFSWGLGLGGMPGTTTRSCSAGAYELQTIGRRPTRTIRARHYKSSNPHPAVDELADGQSLSKANSRDVMIRKDMPC